MSIFLHSSLPTLPLAVTFFYQSQLPRVASSFFLTAPRHMFRVYGLGFVCQLATNESRKEIKNYQEKLAS